ncbi:MAG: GtrA family protein [Betaproteobacteria bacterium]|nr:GtrA family protein [Betaproteobacteria bacterium]
MPNLQRSLIVKFVLVGSLNTAFSYCVFASLVYLGLAYAVANFAALLLGLAFSFRTQGAWVFRNRDKRLWLRFTVCWAAIFVFNIGCIAALMHAGLDVYLAGAVALMPSTIMSYFVQKFLVFGSPRRRLGVTTRS